MRSGSVLWILTIPICLRLRRPRLGSSEKGTDDISAGRFSRDSGDLCLRKCRLSPFRDVADAPDGFGSVVGEIEGAILGDGDADGAAPRFPARGDEAGDEILKDSAGVAVVQGNAHHFIAGAVGAVPGAVLGGEQVATIF